jgi:adenylosuccinate lyase
MLLTTLTAISPLDGRYGNKTKQLRTIVSEYGLIFYRLKIEIAWLIHLTEQSEIHEATALTQDERAFLENILHDFNETEAGQIKTIEQKTNHDVKAVEYYLRDKLVAHATLKRLSPFIHFACTSEDINNLAYALMLKKSRDNIIIPSMEKIIHTLHQQASEMAAFAMLSRTHGQSATPTTLGKEFKNFAIRLEKQFELLRAIPITGKCNGAVGNYNAHAVVYPNIDWQTVSKQFVESLGLTWNAYTTQIEPHDFLAQFFNVLNSCHTILIDFCRDTWGYISLHYFSQKKSAHEVGSSTMPHKINPIDFENAEGNLGIAIALATHLSQKLPISRWQRDLTDSTVLRNIGSIIGYACIAYQSLEKGLSKLIPNAALLKKELEDHWEILAEPIQTMMRRYGIEDAYEQLKDFSRGEKITRESVHQLIEKLTIPPDAKAILLALTPSNYVGYAATLAKEKQMD